MLFNKLVQSPENDYIERGDMVARANEAFASVVPDYAANKERISAELDPLTSRIAEMEKAGQDITVPSRKTTRPKQRR